LPQP
jgi:hypothetical protein